MDVIDRIGARRRSQRPSRRGELIAPRNLGSVLHFEPAETSFPLRWAGMEVAHYRATPGFEIDYAGQTHHGFTL